MHNGSAILDTNIVIGFLNGETNIISRISTVAQIYISSITIGELLFGAACSKNAHKNIQKIQLFISQCRILVIDPQTAREYSEIKLKLKIKGKPIPENDIWLAAQSQQHRLPLFTQDNHFSEVSGIQIEKL